MAFLTRPADTAWVVDSGLADNAVATAQRAGEANKAHYLTAVRASYSSASATGTLTIKVDGTPIARTHVHGAATLEFDTPIKTGEGKAVSAELSASGTAGVTGLVVLIGYTV